jgi:hypothetical protein
MRNGQIVGGIGGELHRPDPMPRTSGEAETYIKARRDSFIVPAVGKIDSMIEATPPYKVPVLSDRDREAVAVAVATVYVDAVLDQLHEWPGATPRNWFYIDGFQEYWLGGARTKSQVAANPVCADWAGYMIDRLKDGLNETITLPDTGETRLLSDFVRVAHGQKWGLYPAFEHNFPILYPTGHRPLHSNSNEHLIVDVWDSLLPVLQDPGYYPLQAIFEGYDRTWLPER